MRYQDWDVLLFPSAQADSRIPMKEFKVLCHVVPDTESSHLAHASFGLPVMTCFIPALPAGTAFHISIHSWATPEISQFTKAYSKHTELAKYEARIMIDGRMVASIAFDRIGSWPQMVSNMYDFTKDGQLEPLKFPPFRQELLQQNHWNPGDDLGRIKIVISEGFPRDSPSVPIERVKNVVAFSFQHAPLDILESNGIAWPNPHMWQRFPSTPSMPVPAYHPDDSSDSHAHSPRRRSLLARDSTSGQSFGLQFLPSVQTQPLMPSTGFPQPFPLVQRSGISSSGSGLLDPFAETSYLEWVNSLGLSQNQSSSLDTRTTWPSFAPRASKQSSSDTTAVDYLSGHLSQAVMPDRMHLSSTNLEGEAESTHLKVPTNTPTAGHGEGSGSSTIFPLDIPNSVIPGDLATSLTQSLLNQPHPLPVQPHQIPLPASEIKSRKENRHLGTAFKGSNPSPASDHSPSTEMQTRKPSSMFSVIMSGSDRVDSMSSGPILGRHTSAGEFGANLTNIVSSAQPPGPSAGTMGGNSLSAGGDKGAKRSRNFTPGSSRANDDDDEPRRLSPHLRVPILGLDGEGEKDD